MPAGDEDPPPNPEPGPGPDPDPPPAPAMPREALEILEELVDELDDRWMDRLAEVFTRLRDARRAGPRTSGT